MRSLQNKKSAFADCAVNLTKPLFRKYMHTLVGSGEKFNGP